MVPEIQQRQFSRASPKAPEQKHPIAWLSVDGEDDHPEQFGVSLAAARFRVSEAVAWQAQLLLVGALLFRAKRSERAESTIAIGPYMLDNAQRSVSLRGKAVDLTAKEFDVVACTFTNVGRLVIGAQSQTRNPATQLLEQLRIANAHVAYTWVAT